jgi:hypothetical protein
MRVYVHMFVLHGACLPSREREREAVDRGLVGIYLATNHCITPEQVINIYCAQIKV